MNPTCRPRASLVSSLVSSLALLVSIAWPASASAQTGSPPGRWVSLGPTKILDGSSGVSNGDVTGRVTAVAVDFFDPNLIYVGGRASGVWRSVDGGGRWEPITDSLPTQTVLALATAPSLPNRVYLNTPVGTYRSEDAGSTWNQVSAVDLMGRGWDGGAMLVDPSDPDLVFLTSCGTGTASPSIRRSIDGGVTWETMLSMGCATGLVRDPVDPNRFLAAISNGGAGTGLWQTFDAGADWTRRLGCDATLPDPAPGTLVKIAQSGHVRFVTFRLEDDAHDVHDFRVFRSDKSCGSGVFADFQWQAAFVAPPALADGEFWSAIHVNPQDPSRVAVTGVRVFVSTDGGFTFDQPAPQPHVDHHAWIYHPADPSIVLAGTDGGPYRSTNDGLAGSWTFIGEGIVNAELFDLADAATSPRLLFAGSQDNGAFEFPGTGTVWRRKAPSDVEMVEIDPTNADVRYFAFQAQSSLFRTTDAFATPPTAIGSGLPTDPLVCPPPWSTEYPADPLSQFLISPANPSVLLVACGSLWRGQAWTPIFDPVPGKASTVAVDASTYIYWIGSDLGDIWASASGMNWTRLFHHPFAVASVAIQLDPADPRVLFAAFRPNGQAEKRVYRLVRLDNPPTLASAVDITSNLPQGIRMKSLAVDRMQPHTIYAGTDFGVYRGHSSDGGVTWTWTAYKDGMPEAVDVRALEVHPVTGTLRAGTFGRGVYEVDTDWPIGALVAVEGRVTVLRAQDVGQGFGPPGDVIDADVIVQLDTTPGYSYGFQLRLDGEAAARRGMLDRLRDALRRDTRVRLEYVRTGFRNGLLRRVWNLP